VCGGKHRDGAKLQGQPGESRESAMGEQAGRKVWTVVSNIEGDAAHTMFYARATRDHFRSPAACRLYAPAAVASPFATKSTCALFR
jgi:hypothetical protein